MRNVSVWAIAVALLAGCQASGNTTVPARGEPLQRRATATLPTGIVIPMYVDPGKYWDEAIAAKTANPDVPMILIANVNNGPGSKSAQYATYIKKAQAAGILVFGYTYTQYGKRSQSIVDEAIVKWYAYYRVDGAFLDEMAPNDAAYYRAITAYAHAHSVPLVMGNPGDNAPGNAGPDIINFFEQHGYPSPAFLKERAHLNYGKQRWSYMAGAVPFDAAAITASVPYASYIWATGDGEPECYCNLPTYFSQLVTLLSSLDSQAR
jgi:hypothetical protein